MKLCLSVMTLLSLHVAAAYAQEPERLQVAERGGRLLGQIIACGGHPQFGYADKKVREKSWGGLAHSGPSITSYLDAKRAALDAQKTNQSGITCDEVKLQFEEFIEELG